MSNATKVKTSFGFGLVVSVVALAVASVMTGLNLFVAILPIWFMASIGALFALERQ